MSPGRLWFSQGDPLSTASPQVGSFLSTRVTSSDSRTIQLYVINIVNRTIDASQTIHYLNKLSIEYIYFICIKSKKNMIVQLFFNKSISTII